MNIPRIQKTETRYNIFVSSPFEPKWIRGLAQQSIIFAGHIPYMYEQHAPIRSTIESIHSLIDDSQIYILLLGHRLGSRPTEDSKTYTELEFDYAMSKPNMRVIALYQAKDEAKKARKQIEDDQKESDNERDYWKFYEYISTSPDLLADKRFISQPWRESATEALASLITAQVNGITKILDDLPTPLGWVRATDINTQNEIVKSFDNEIRVEIIRKFNDFEKLDDRCKVERESKKAIAKAIHEQIIPTVIANKYHMFLDSGSTVAYVAQRIGKYVRDRIRMDDEGKPNIEVLTNNALAYLHLWLVSGVPCRMFPPGIPEMPYGAAYGPISDYGRDTAKKEIGPDYGRIDLDESDKSRMTEIEQMFLRHHKNLIPRLFMIGTISGLKLGKGNCVDVKWGECIDIENENTNKEIYDSQGFHTGNYYP